MTFKDYLIERIETNEIIKTIYKDCRPYIDELRRINAKHFFYRGSSRTAKDILKIKPRQDRQPKDMPYEVHNYIDDYFYKKHRWRPRSEGVFTSYKKGTAMDYGEAHAFFPIGKYLYLFSEDVEDLYSYIDQNPNVQDAISGTEPDFSWYDGEYYDQYGEDSGNGSWWYEGKDTGESNKSDAVDEVFDSIEEEFENENQINDIKDNIEDTLEWVPEIDFDSYVADKWEKEREKVLSDFDDTLDTYQSKNLKKAAYKGFDTPEVMWKCKEYYIVPYDLEPFLIEGLLESDTKKYKNLINILDKQMLLPFKWSKKR